MFLVDSLWYSILYYYKNNNIATEVDCRYLQNTRQHTGEKSANSLCESFPRLLPCLSGCVFCNLLIIICCWPSERKVRVVKVTEIGMRKSIPFIVFATFYSLYWFVVERENCPDRYLSTRMPLYMLLFNYFTNKNSHFQLFAQRIT